MLFEENIKHGMHTLLNDDHANEVEGIMDNSGLHCSAAMKCNEQMLHESKPQKLSRRGMP